MRLPMKAKGVAGQHGQFFEGLAQRHAGGQHNRRCLPATHHFQQFHDVGRAEEMQTQHVLGADGDVGDGVHIQIRGVGGQHDTGAGVGIYFSKHLLFDGQFLKHGFNHQVGTGQFGPVGAG
jgi:hypothetical protein